MLDARLDGLVANEKGETMSRNKNVNYAQYVHAFVDANGVTRYAVGAWDEEKGQYTCPMTDGEMAATGCHTKFAKTPAGLGGYVSRARALRRARYIFGQMAQNL